MFYLVMTDVRSAHFSASFSTSRLAMASYLVGVTVVAVAFWRIYKKMFREDQNITIDGLSTVLVMDLLICFHMRGQRENFLDYIKPGSKFQKDFVVKF